MTRRKFIAGLGSAAAWPVVARAQQVERVRRIGVLITQAESDGQQQSFVAAFDMRLREIGWTDGKNVRIDYRWSGGEARIALLAKDLVELKPDVLFAANTSCAVALRRYTLAIPIVFVQIADPVAAGLVTNLARPEGNITGFTNYEYAIGGKWIQALKEAAPGLRRAAVLFDPASVSWPLHVRAVEAAAPSLGVQLIPAPVQSDAEIERAFAVQSQTVPSSRSRPQASDCGAKRLSHLRRGTICPRYTLTVIMPRKAASCPTAPIRPTNIGKRRPMSTAS